MAEQNSTVTGRTESPATGPATDDELRRAELARYLKVLADALAVLRDMREHPAVLAVEAARDKVVHELGDAPPPGVAALSRRAAGRAAGVQHQR